MRHRPEKCATSDDHPRAAATPPVVWIAVNDIAQMVEFANLDDYIKAAAARGR
jgi:hypothetical protein